MLIPPCHQLALLSGPLFYGAETSVTFRCFLFAFVCTAALAACDTGITTTPPAPPPPAQTRVLGIRLDPDTVAVADTVLIHAVIEDSLDTRFRFLWGMQESTMLPVDGRMDGSRIRFVAPRTSTESGRVVSIGTSVIVTNDVPGTRSVLHSFDIPVLN